MSLRKAVRLILLACVLSVGASIGVYTATAKPGPEAAKNGTLIVDGPEPPKTIGEMASRSDFVLVGRVMGIEPGPPIVVDAEQGLEVPTQLVELEVESAIHGEAEDTVLVARIGSEDFAVEDDPGYAIDQKYLLFLETGQGDAGDAPGGEPLIYTTVAPEGRLASIPR